MEMEIDSEIPSHAGSTNKPSPSKPFRLPILQNKDKISKQETFESYLNNKNSFSEERKSHLSDLTARPVPSDFTPWWESFTSTEMSNKRSSSKGSQKQNGTSLYNNWFDKSSTSTDSSSWLCGPAETPQTSAQSTSQVDDIEVPSIYVNALTQPKGRRALKRERKEERGKTAGKKWFNMKMPDPDSQLKTDMELLQMRQALQSKKFFRRNDRKTLPKYFQMGTVVDEGTDFYSSRLTRKERKRTLVEEMMADVNIRQKSKKKYQELKMSKRSNKTR